MRYLILFLLFGCADNAIIDLTPSDGVHTEFAINVPELNKVIYHDSVVQDTGWYVIDPIEDIYSLSPFIKNIQYIATDTFQFGWHDYDPVMKQIHRIANNFDISNSVVSRNYKWLNQFYSNGTCYLIPMFNNKGDRYWLQVFRDKVNWFQTYYTARGVWIISNPKPIKGDVS